MNAGQKKPGYLFSQESINSLVELGSILEKIHIRMKKEGYDIIDGRIIHLESGNEYEPTQNGKS